MYIYIYIFLFYPLHKYLFSCERRCFRKSTHSLCLC